MIQNKAAQDLANLTQSTQAAQAQAERMAARDREAGTAGPRLARQAGDRQEAKFAGPEALATAVTAGFVLGPAGGLLLGLAQGILGKRERQNILDDAAAQNEALGGAQDVLNGQFDRLMQGTTNKNDVEQLETLRTQQDAAFKLLYSGSPKLQAQGMQLLQNVQSQVNEYTDLQESQRIEAEVRDAEIARATDQEGYNRYKSIQADFDKDSALYEETIAKGNEILRLLEAGTPAALTAATIGMAKLLDPEGVVRPGEAEAWGAIGSLWDSAGNLIEQLRDGRPLNADQAREMQAVVTSVIDGRKQIQLARESRYAERLVDAGVPEKYWNNFQFVQDVPSYSTNPIDWESLPDAVKRKLPDNVKAAANTLNESVQANVFDGADEYMLKFMKGLAAMKELSESSITVPLPWGNQDQEQKEQN